MKPYVLKNDGNFDEAVQIGNEIVPVAIDPASAAPDFQKLYEKLSSAQAEVQQPNLSAERLVELNQVCGDCIIELMTLIFGEDGAAKIINFYKDNYAKMIYAIIPFIRDRIKPMLDRYLKDIQKTYRKSVRRW